MTDPPVAPGESQLEALLERPASERLREHRYRFAQAMVFGLPVLALEFFGHSLGGEEAERWVPFLQALLAGWVIYVGASGMLIEGLLMIRRKLMPDLLVAAIAAAIYLISLSATVFLLTTGRHAGLPIGFHWAVLLIALWTGLQWWRWHRAIRAEAGGPI